MRMPGKLPEDCVFVKRVFVIDTSSSMNARLYGRAFSGTRLETTCEALCRCARRSVEIERENPALTGAMGLVAFTDCALEVMDLTVVREAEAGVRRAVQSLKPVGNTYFCSGLNLGREILKRNDLASKYPEVGFIDELVLLSDGENNGPDDPIELANDIKASGMLIFTVGVGDAISEEGKTLLQELASMVDEERWYRHVTDCDELIDCFAGLAGHITR